MLTSSISMCVLGEAVDNGVDCFLEDGLGPRVGHRTRHWPTARGNGGCGLRLRPRHVRRHDPLTLCLSRDKTHGTHKISIQSMGQTHVKTHRFPFCLSHQYSERAGKSEKHARYGRRDVCVSCSLLCFAPGWTNFPCDQIGGAPRKYFLLLLFKGERTGAWELANDRFLWRIK